jgi:hypothetical protein
MRTVRLYVPGVTVKAGGGEIVGIVFILLPQCFAIRSSLHSSRLNQVHFTFISVYPVPGFLIHGVA